MAAFGTAVTSCCFFRCRLPRGRIIKCRGHRHEISDHLSIDCGWYLLAEIALVFISSFFLSFLDHFQYTCVFSGSIVGTMSSTATCTCTVTPSMPEIGPEIPIDKVAVKLPNLFQSFLKQAPPLNPHYDDVRLESERWLTR